MDEEEVKNFQLEVQGGGVNGVTAQGVNGVKAAEVGQEVNGVTAQEVNGVKVVEVDGVRDEEVDGVRDEEGKIASGDEAVTERGRRVDGEEREEVVENGIRFQQVDGVKAEGGEEADGVKKAEGGEGVEKSEASGGQGGKITSEDEAVSTRRRIEEGQGHEKVVAENGIKTGLARSETACLDGVKKVDGSEIVEEKQEKNLESSEKEEEVERGGLQLRRSDRKKKHKEIESDFEIRVSGDEEIGDQRVSVSRRKISGGTGKKRGRPPKKKMMMEEEEKLEREENQEGEEEAKKEECLEKDENDDDYDDGEGKEEGSDLVRKETGGGRGRGRGRPKAKRRGRKKKEEGAEVREGEGNNGKGGNGGNRKKNEEKAVEGSVDLPNDCVEEGEGNGYIKETGRGRGAGRRKKKENDDEDENGDSGNVKEEDMEIGDNSDQEDVPDDEKEEKGKRRSSRKRKKVEYYAAEILPEGRSRRSNGTGAGTPYTQQKKSMKVDGVLVKFDGNGNPVESNMCHQCQRNDKGQVVRCTKCKSKRYCLPCMTRWYV